jgi:Tfp pilus assembly protein PilX
MRKTNKQHGAVSLFVVIFAALLITVVTVSFIRIMIQNQQQSTANDLSQSAYDSAQAGVEDGKRALLILQNICDPNNSAYDQNTCTAAQTTCNAGVDLLKDVKNNTTTDGTNEVKVQTTKAGDVNLNQAYTCVKIITNTPDVEEYIATDASKIIPLVGVNSAGLNSFDRIRIDWFTSNDSATATVPTGSTSLLPMKSDWPSSQPPIMRAQLIEYNNSSLSLSNIDGGSGTNNTLFLYPSNSVNALIGFSTGIPGSPTKVSCNSIASGGYSCSTTILLSNAIINGDHTAFLNLKSIYNGAHYKVTLLDSIGATVLFNNVQPSIDSTGRANDLFRRVQTRVEYSNIDFSYPQAEINVTGNLCKNFIVTADSGPGKGYSNSCSP